MYIAGFPAGPWATNCWVVAPGPRSECIVIDPGMDTAAGIADMCAQQGLKPVAVMLTHGHIDHMWSVFPVSKQYDIPAFVHADDRYRIGDPGKVSSPQTRALIEQFGGTFAEPDDLRDLQDGDSLDLAGLQFNVRHAPGHTEGSVVFGLNSADAPLLFSGDVLFKGAIGRTDLQGGNHAAMLDSLSRVILPLPDETVVHCGHGESTSIGFERINNPYLRGLGATA